MTLPLLTCERALRNFKTNPTPKNAKRLISTLEQAEFCILLRPSSDSASGSLQQQLNGLIASEKYESIPVHLIDTRTEAGIIFPVFTGLQQLPKGIEKEADVITVSFAVLCLLAAFHSFDSIVLNPNTDPLAFKRGEFLQRFLSAGAD